MNQALVFVKPHATNPKCIKFVREQLEKNDIRVIHELTRSSKRLERSIDDHYAIPAGPAVIDTPDELPVSESAKIAFKNSFGEDWDTVLREKRVVNAKTFAEMYDQVDLSEEWDHEKTVKARIGTGTKVAKLVGANDRHSRDHHYVVNGFYLAMRNRFVNSSAEVHFFLVEFDEKKVPWEVFRRDIVGTTDPAKAVDGSLRNLIYKGWKDLGLGSEPDYGNNGVHASAGPLEAFRERLLWDDEFVDDPFNKHNVEQDQLGSELLRAGIDMSDIIALLSNADVQAANSGEYTAAFDATENMNTSDAISFIKGISHFHNREKARRSRQIRKTQVLARSSAILKNLAAVRQKKHHAD
eukprot:CAMPEP_0184037648 /NCGR_PEP_ID=MMETSP0955-20130417/41201_1 /TAXON_ID=627963 /ORGANISM="Aplanochytrium sp, Strain PBS07" /LENGTH=353 /DNA_ID=CAMNT_0026325865 /DNA_START=135 /DNA_END=1196 /DNA_ORIENTATION=+